MKSGGHSPPYQKDKAMTEHDLIAITEQIVDWRSADFAVRLDERLLSRVLLSGGASKNGHRYADSALREAAALYDRKPVFLDHAANLAKPFDRSTRDLAGWIAEASYAEGHIQGNIQLLDTEAGRTLLALMSSETPAVGMSHVILARKSADGTLVEKIHDVISVDAVVFPATTAGFREQRDGELASDVPSEAEESLRRIGELEEELARVIREREELRQRCAELSAQMLQHDIDRQLAAADLDDELVTATLREKLRTTPDAAARSRLIAEHRQFLLRCRQRAPCSRARAVETREDPVLKQIVRAVKGSRRD
jgi:hypothetical protein